MVHESSDFDYLKFQSSTVSHVLSPSNVFVYTSNNIPVPGIQKSAIKNENLIGKGHHRRTKTTFLIKNNGPENPEAVKCLNESSVTKRLRANSQRNSYSHN